jgi:hypothetical protein
MAEIAGKLSSWEWWFSAVAVALVVNIASSIILEVLKPRLAKVFDVIVTTILWGHVVLCVVVLIVDIWSQYRTLWIIPFIVFMAGVVLYGTAMGTRGPTLRKFIVLANQWLTVAVGMVFKYYLYPPEVPNLHIYVGCVFVSSVFAPITLQFADFILRRVAPKYAGIGQRD